MFVYGYVYMTTVCVCVCVCMLGREHNIFLCPDSCRNTEVASIATLGNDTSSTFAFYF